MPRGFLVKRHRRGSASYRSRSNNNNPEGDRNGGGGGYSCEATGAESHVLSVFPFQRQDGEFPVSREDSAGVREAWSPHVESALEAEADRRAQLPESELDALSPDGDFSCFFPPPPPPLTDSCSPVKPVGTRLLEQREEGEKQLLFTGRCLPSSPVPDLPELPFLVSSTPTSVSASIERILASSSRHHAPSYGHGDKYDPPHVHLFPHLTVMSQEAARKRSFLEPSSSRHSKQSACSNPTKKPKVNRKLNFEDEVTTSPVLGLRIKKESPELRRHREKSSGPGGNQPLGEFICQLCKEEYPDPFSLAQHKCSRIVRVEYRCPECDKVFSCPANLASHRRWHKPRPVSSPAGETPTPNKNLSLKEARGLAQHERPPVELEGKENELLRVYECRYCGKKFRRQAYLKKHLAAHEMTSRASPPAASYGQAREPSSGQSQVCLCHLCGARFPSVEIRDKHRLWHQQQIFTCKHCPSTFFSSPGLTRHINKSHPTENRQVMLLQMTVRP
uniref:INSM transcriptional repressor 2 n=1 Tax=Haplochromis burtoni TaxID=8153 RepID=A0A3Q2VSQ0_HAPBU